MINQFFSEQASKENQKLASRLHDEMNANFLKYAMYDINDALTSILAICDMEEIKNIPKIKQYIQRVNGLLNNVQTYQSNVSFNINHVLKNIIDIIKVHFKSNTKVKCNFSEVKSMAKGDKLQLERVLLYILIELINTEQGLDPAGISIDLYQKEKDAQIIIKKANHKFNKSASEEISRLTEGLADKVSIDQNQQGIEIVIRLPLDFTKSKKSDQSSITVSDIKVAKGSSSKTQQFQR